MSRRIGHGGGGVNANAEGPRPFGRWMDSRDIVI
jgi:hypothetical protein